MTMRDFHFVAVVPLVFAAQAAATDVYKCTDAQGNVAFQDRPCPQNAQQAEVWLPDLPPAPVQSADAPSAPSAASVLPPPVRYVPLGVLGFPGHSLSQAYGPGGIGVSAPGMRQIPIDHSPRDAIASQYTPLQDECARASREQTCGWLQKQYDDVTHKLHNAFKDQQAILQPQADELERELNGC